METQNMLSDKVNMLFPKVQWTPWEDPFGAGRVKMASGRQNMLFPKGSLWGGKSKNAISPVKYG